jgi:hypothetical protein
MSLFNCGVVVGMVTLEQVQIIEQLISNCADELDSGLDSRGVTVVAETLYRLAAVIRVIRRGEGRSVDLVEFVGRFDEWVDPGVRALCTNRSRMRINSVSMVMRDGVVVSSQSVCDDCGAQL